MRRLVLSVLLSMLLGTLAHADDWWNDAWKVRHRIDINSAFIDKPLEAFPLCIRVPAAYLKTDALSPDGRDARVVDANGNVLPHELVAWSDRGIELYTQWTLANDSPQWLYLYYGNPDASAAPAADVWDEHYRAVLHLAGDAKDASGAGSDVAPEGSVTLSDEGAVFTEAAGHLSIPPAAFNGLGEQLTITVRFQMREGPGLQNLLAGRRTDGPEEWFNFGIKTPNIVHTNATSNGQRAPELNPAGIAPGQWHTAIVRYDARDRSRTICIDGVVFERDESLPGPLRVNEVRIGRGMLHFEPWQFHGVIDEVRIAATARSDAWMKAEAGCLAELNVVAPVGRAQGFGEADPEPASFAVVYPKSDVIWKKRTEPLKIQWTPSAGARRYRVSFFDTVDSPNSHTVTVDGTAMSVRGRSTGSGDVSNDGATVLPAKTYRWSVTALGDADAVGPSVDGPGTITFYDWSAATPRPVTPAARPVLEPAGRAAFNLRGYLRTRIDNTIHEYLISTPTTSPAILQVLRDRDKRPVRDPLVPWAGEFAGKYLTAAQLTWRLTQDAELKRTIDAFVRDLIACQQDDGYLGPFPKSSRITGGNWDVWGHYHCMLGLLLYYEDTGYTPALQACEKAADLLFEVFGPGGPTLTNDGAGGQMNMAVCHALVLLYNKTGQPRYLELAHYIVHEAWNDAGAGRYLESALAGKPIVEFPQHRWEAIHDWQALPELYWLTGDEPYKKAFEHIWRSALAGDRHNTGGLTSGEGFTGSPFNTGAIETCCTVAWIAMSIDMLRLTGDARVADELELSTFNSALGAIPFGGRSCAYNVPMNGTRLFGVELHWQAPKGGPDLNCCAVNAVRPLGMIAQWALMARRDGGLALNFYGPCTMTSTLPSGNTVNIEQVTDYPQSGKVTLRFTLDRPQSFPLQLRVPVWSRTFTMAINGRPVTDMLFNPGSYTGLEREWKTGDTLDLEFDFTPHFWAGGESFAGTVSFYRGPIVYAYDARYNVLNPDELPAIDPGTVQFTVAQNTHDSIPPWIHGSLNAVDGTRIDVVDFSSAGQTGNHYKSWLPSTGTPTWQFFAP